MSNSSETKPNAGKFLIFSLLGIFLFLTPIPDGEGAFNIFLGMIIGWINGFFNPAGGFLGIEGLDFRHWIVLAIITVSFCGTVAAQWLKPSFIMNNPRLKNTFVVSPLYFATRIIAFAIVLMLITGNGPDSVIAAWTGDVMIDVVAGIAVIFIVLPLGLPFLTEFGFMEFLGTLVRKVVRVLFTLPGRASVDLLASWFGSSAASIVITTGQLDKGYYTRREAAVSATNFATVSIPFTLVVVNTIGLDGHFFTFYAVMGITVLILAMIMPRIWPLRGITNTYVEDVGKQIQENEDTGGSLFSAAVTSATKKANAVNSKTFVSSIKDGYLSLLLDLVPIILAWGTLALMVHELTDVLDWISQPMGWYLNIFQVPDAFAYAPATLVGFMDMFIPALLLGNAPINTQFILGVLSIVQLIYLAETGALIIKSKIPLGVGKLFAIFMIRTIIAIPIIVVLTSFLFNP
ncbi:MAG: hypothetical protein FWG63_09970 [Defluviitaleaceae bacterium]|nr:hypothetical protein [Defluviitaleaceae bacterium]